MSMRTFIALELEIREVAPLLETEKAMSYLSTSRSLVKVSRMVVLSK